MSIGRVLGKTFTAYDIMCVCVRAFAGENRVHTSHCILASERLGIEKCRACVSGAGAIAQRVIIMVTQPHIHEKRRRASLARVCGENARAFRVSVCVGWLVGWCGCAGPKSTTTTVEH